MGLKCHASRTNQALHRLSFVPLNLRCDNGKFHFLRDVSHESGVFTSSAFTFWGKSSTKASLSHRQLSLLREVSHESVVFTTSRCSFLRMFRRIAAFSRQEGDEKIRPQAFRHPCYNFETLAPGWPLDYRGGLRCWNPPCISNFKALT